MTVIETVDFEEGDFSDFDATFNSVDMAVNTTAAMVGTYGLAATLDGALNTTRGTNVISAPTSVIRGRFYFDPNGITMTSGDVHTICVVGTDGTLSGISYLMRFNLKNNAGTYQVGMIAYNDDTTTQATTFADITDAPHYLEWQITRESTSTAADGTADVWVDGSLQSGGLTNVANFDLFPTIDGLALGHVTALDAGTTGTTYFDDFIVNDDGSEIGSAASALTIDIGPVNNTVQGVKVIG